MNHLIQEKSRETTTQRTLIKRFAGVATSDGAGVKLTRIIGSPQINMFDPFLLLDCFESDESKDYIGGFPLHPHRGFETVTYLLNGRMRHKDNAGHEGVIESGGVQWMTAGKGILHSEMPEQEEGLMKGFQLWVNLPKSAKMAEPNYQEFPPDAMPVEHRENGAQVRVISGKTDLGTRGPVINEYTDPLYLDIHLPAGEHFSQLIPEGYNAFVYVIDGELNVIAQNATAAEGLSKKMLGILSDGEQLSVSAGESESRFLLIAGKPLNEPVARGGPFVMNTREEVEQAFDDYNRGLFY